MIVFYTFDIPNNSNKSNSILMLNISIYTVLRELGMNVDLILIFSNNSEELKQKLSVKDKRILFKKIDKRFSNKIQKSKLLYRYDGGFRDENEHFRIIGNSFGTAHSRVYLFSRIFTKYKKDILYLDYDTGIAKGCGKNALSLMLDANIMLEPLTSYDIVNDIMSIYPRLKMEQIPSYVNTYACRWNSGVVYIKYDIKNFKILNDIKFYYYRLNIDLGFMQSADEWSIGLSLFHNNIRPKSTFNDSSFFVPGSQSYLHKNLNTPSPFVHYMDQKNLESNNIKWLEMLTSWESFFKSENKEPEFQMWDYTKRNSNEYLWGRFETL
jgi:hypothetical protein